MKLEIRDDQCTHTVDVDSADDVAEACQDWVEGGEWGPDGASVTVWWTLYDADGDEIDSGSETVEVEPDHDALIRAAGGDTDCDHIWTSAGEGGLSENPGVWSNGGTSMTFATHCRLCGLRRTEHHCGSQRNPGDHDTTTYELMSDEEIEQMRESGYMN